MASTPLLGLSLPADGTTNWGTLVNTSITALLDSAVAGTTTLSSDADVTLSATTEAANQARQAIILWNATGTVTRNITAPAQSKTYVVINATGGTQSIVFRGAGPTTGVTIPAGRAFMLVWNGTDFVTTGVTTVNLATDVTGTLGVGNGGTGQTTYTDGQLLIGNSTGNTLTKATLTAGIGISVTNGAGSISIANTAPDQTVTLTQGGATTITGTYPNFTISSVNTTYGTATSTVPGLIELGSDTVQTTAANAVTSDALRTYAIQLNGSGQAVVNVPWTGGTSGVTGVTASSPVNSSGGTTPNIALAVSYGDTQNPYGNKTPNLFLASPNGTTGLPTFRAVVAADIPTLNQNTSGTAAGIAGGAANRILYNTGAGVTSFIAAPTVTSTYLQWNGSAFVWAAATSGTTFATDITVNSLTVGQGAGTPTVPFQNTALGINALSSSTNSTTNVAIGRDAMQLNQTGGSNTAVGYAALRDGTAPNSNVAIGFSALRTNNGAYNVAVGSSALILNTSGARNTALGYETLQTISFSTSSDNTAVGSSALGLSNAAQNTAVGSRSLLNLTSSAAVTAVGYQALSALTSSTNNAAGFGANTAVTGANQVQLGDSATTTYVYGTVQNRSDARDKCDIRDTVLGLEFIKALRPVDYRWDMREYYRESFDTLPKPPEAPDSQADQSVVDGYQLKYDEFVKQKDAWIARNKLANISSDGTKKRNRFHHGLVAQEVKQLIDSLDVDFGGYQDHKVAGGEDVLSIGYDELIAPLIKAVQQLNAKVEALEAVIQSRN
jgi:hypothetical protein